MIVWIDYWQNTVSKTEGIRVLASRLECEICVAEVVRDRITQGLSMWKEETTIELQGDLSEIIRAKDHEAVKKAVSHSFGMQEIMDWVEDKIGHFQVHYEIDLDEEDALDVIRQFLPSRVYNLDKVLAQLDLELNEERDEV